ncbi:MAG: polyribonucleotide nucleotidyltransferase [Thermodesulfobacteriota bacterium]
MPHKIFEKQLFDKKFKFEIGKVAKQASGAVLVTCEGTTVLATVVASREKIEGENFLPLTINYQEKSYAAGKIPGGYFKREGRSSEQEVLISRLIDRPIRPLIPIEFNYPTQVMITVLSADGDNPPDTLSVNAASAAIMLSDIPFEGPIAGVRVTRINNEFICNPTKEQNEQGDIDIVVVGTNEALVMVEGGAKEATESDVIDALLFAHDCIRELIKIQEEMIEGLNIEKREITVSEINSEIKDAVYEFAGPKLRESIIVDSKTTRRDVIQKIYNDFLDQYGEQFEDQETDISKSYEQLLKELVREIIVKDKIRLDSRDYEKVRNIDIDVSFLPRTHGSALFTRGETQAAVVTTLGTAYDQQRIDSLDGDITKKFMMHYNFPPYSVGETSNRLAPGRREIGHGALAERAIKPVLPENEDFPYTIRIVSEILESNGSSSMATVCGASLSLMDAGVPISSPVAGIAMGLIKEGDDFVILSDILGDEDHLGDMDFKVAGTKDGITAVQMDIKVTGVTKEIMEKALNQAKDARLYVLDKMNAVISASRDDISEYAPKIMTMTLPQDKIKDVIGPGGKTIKKIVEITGVQIDINDDGTVNIASPDSESCQSAVNYINTLIEELEVGKVYLGKVKRILDFGAVVELLNGKDGLVHISELAPERVKSVSDILKEGEEILVKCISKERDGKVRLSRKEALNEKIEDYKTV